VSRDKIVLRNVDIKRILKLRSEFSADLDSLLRRMDAAKDQDAFAMSLEEGLLLGDYLSDYLAKSGFDEGYRLTPEGEEVDRIIYRLSGLPF
jgi:hypothetical protein